MSAELMAEITRLTTELQKISRIWDIAHEFQERHIARMEEENRGQRAEIIELKAQRDCDREAIANYERMVADHGGRAQKSSASAQLTADILSLYQERNEALAEVERLTGERDRLDSSVRFLQRCLKADRERLSLAEKLAERVRLRRGSLNAGDARALDAFISSASAERWACKTCGDTAIVARDANSKICWKCPSCMAMCSTPGDCDLEPECSFRPLSSPDHPTPPAQPSKDPAPTFSLHDVLSPEQIGYYQRLIDSMPESVAFSNGGEVKATLVDMLNRIARRERELSEQQAAHKRRKARLTSLEEENAATKIVNGALNAECMGLKAGNAKLRAFRDAAARDIRHRHDHWIDGRECYTCCEPWPCPPIAALDATEPALVEEEREMSAQAQPKDHARALAEAARDILNNRECSCFRGIPGHSVAIGVCQRCVVSFDLLAEALADYEREASGPGAGGEDKA